MVRLAAAATLLHTRASLRAPRRRLAPPAALLAVVVPLRSPRHMCSSPSSCPSFHPSHYSFPNPFASPDRSHRRYPVMRCYYPSGEVTKRALLRGLDPSQVHVYGLPIRPSFCCSTLDEDELRRELGMDAALPSVLLVRGGEGMCRLWSSAAGTWPCGPPCSGRSLSRLGGSRGRWRSGWALAIASSVRMVLVQLQRP